MKHSTFRKSSLISSVALLLVAIVALSGATFAWFSTNTTADATGINASTTQGSNLILAEAANGPWKNSLDLKAASHELAPATTNDLTSWATAKADSWDGQVPGKDGYSVLDKDASTENVYIKKTIYVQHAAGEGAAAHPLKATLDVQVDEGNESFKQFDYYRVAIAPVAGTEDNGLSNNAFATTYYSIKDKNHATYDNGDPTWGNYTTTTKTEIDLGSIDANKVYGYDVYIWFEGEDLDCIDTYSANDITLDIDFK